MNKKIEKHNDVLNILSNRVTSIPKEQHQSTLMSIIRKFEAHEKLSEDDKSFIQDVISDKLVNCCLNSEFEPTSEGLYLEELIDYVSNL